MCIFEYKWNIVEEIIFQWYFQPPRDFWCAKLYGAIQSTDVRHYVFWRKVMQFNYKLDLAIIQFSAYDNPLPLHTNKSVFSTFTSITINRPSFFFLQNSKEVVNFHQLTNQNSPKISIDTKFQEWRKFTSAYYLFQLTAFQRSFNVFLWVYVEKVENRSLFNVVFSLPENFDMQRYKEQFRALVSNSQFFNAEWFKYNLGLILQWSNFQHMSIPYLLSRIGQSFLHLHPLR